MRLIPLLLLALASAAPAQVPIESSRPTSARWDIQVLNGNRYLRATSENGSGRGKLMFLCNQVGRVVVMAMLLGAEANGTAEAAASGGIVIDGRVETAPEPGQPIVMNGSLVSLLAVEPARFRRIMNAEAVGIRWTRRDLTNLAGFQVALAEGRESLAAFARECNAQAYP